MEISNSEQRVYDELKTFLDELPALIQALPLDETYKSLRDSAMNFLYTAEGIGIVSDLEQAASGFSGLDGPEAYPLAVTALEKMQQLISTFDAANAWMQQGEQCLRFQPSISRVLGNTLQQILDAMSGSSGQGPASGYSTLAEETALYGPETELPRIPEAGGEETPSGAASSKPASIMDDSAEEPDLEMPDTEGRVKLIENMKFPARYRKLIGDYFRKISEEGSR